MFCRVSNSIDKAKKVPYSFYYDLAKISEYLDYFIYFCNYQI